MPKTWIQSFGEWTKAWSGVIPILAVIGLAFIGWSDLANLKTQVAQQQCTISTLSEFKTIYDAQSASRDDLVKLLKSHIDRADFHQTPRQIRSAIGDEIRPLSEQMVKIQTIQEQNQRQLTRMEDMLMKLSTGREKTVIGSK